MAGTTLISFSNGATDLITSITASSQGRDNIMVAVLYGASTFSLTVVLANVIMVSLSQQIKNVRESSTSLTTMSRVCVIDQ